MPVATEEFVSTIRTTNRSSHHYGNCELCNQHASEIFTFTRHRVYINDDGMRYLSPTAAGTYAHRQCIEDQFGEPVEHESLPRLGHLLLPPVINPTIPLYVTRIA